MSRTRRVVGLEWARMGLEKPSFSENGKKIKGSNAIKQGHSYEKRFISALRTGVKRPEDVRGGEWIRFKDQNGLGWAQPDAILFRENRIFLFECKLTENSRAWVQLYCLYTPLLQSLFPEMGLVRVQVCRNLKLGGTGFEFGLEGQVVSKPSQLVDGCVWNWR